VTLAGSPDPRATRHHPQANAASRPRGPAPPG
jgi:hypothetical protein